MGQSLRIEDHQFPKLIAFSRERGIISIDLMSTQLTVRLNAFLRIPPRRRYREMKGQTSKGLRIAILVYTIYSAVYGLVHVVSPELVGAEDPAIERVLGAAVLAFAFGAGLAYLEKSWVKARIAVLVQVVWMILYTITMVWGILVGGIAAAAWPPAIIGAVFAVLLAVLYIREERVNR